MDARMRKVRNIIGGMGNLMFKEAFIVGKMLDGEVPDQYVQSYKYWEKYRGVIWQLFRENIGTTDKVAIHIRRGDYRDTDFYTDLTKTEYYQKAVSQFPDAEFLVFCMDRQNSERDEEDRAWCREHLPVLLGKRFSMAPIGEDESDDLNLMASCKGIIMANSSFSWWAAFLSNAGTKIIAPSQWFTDSIKRIDLLPEWQQI